MGANIIFGCGCKRGFYTSTFYFSLHFSTDSLANFGDAFGIMTRQVAPPPLGSPGGCHCHPRMRN